MFEALQERKNLKLLASDKWVPSFKPERKMQIPVFFLIFYEKSFQGSYEFVITIFKTLPSCWRAETNAARSLMTLLKAREEKRLLKTERNI